MKCHRQRFRRTHLLPALLAAVTVFLGSSCMTQPRRGPEESSQALARIRELEDQRLRLIEKEALIEHLEQRLLSQQRLVDDAIQEVVRVKAKQRSLESRAEAASELAEAEIALKSFRDNAAGTNRPEVASAEQLLTMATKEFENENFGGALYLVGQVKNQIKIGKLRLGQSDQLKGPEGEMPFAIPLSLVVNKNGNIREGPGLEFEVLVTLDEGTPLTGYSTKGSWLRVQSGGGWSGWIHRSLVGAI